ncbi:MAG TPA: ERCC4 domain-containing protein [Nitrososphaerales archaeon]|nr:ERCC4 domain-containing protein [Nitrososphaerales archaeon]
MEQKQSLSEGSRFVSLPLIKRGLLEERTYQIEVAKNCAAQNTLVVLPTGLGKTSIAALIVAEFLSRSPDSRALVLAPTRVLVNQHYSFFANHLDLRSNEIAILTGEDPTPIRDSVWSRRLVCATPQVTVVELEKGKFKVEDFSLIIFDEVHRAVGNYAYTQIASMYNEFRKDGRIIGMTASLPSDRTKIEEILAKLKITKIETRDERSDDVKPFVFKTDVEWIEVQLDPELKAIQELLRSSLNARLKMMEDAALLHRNNYGSITLKDLLKLRTRVDQIQSSQLRNALFSSIRLHHALNLLETQSLRSFSKFMDRLNERKRGFGMAELLKDDRIREACEKSKLLLAEGKEHPKIRKILDLAKTVGAGERGIIFASYRDTVEQIHAELVKNGFKAGYLIGKSGETGQSQKSQIRSLQQLREGVYDILIATQVGEEGLDVADCNVVVFYDNVPSAVRFVQRKGRTGRRKDGRLYVLITKGTRDEAYYWLSKKRLGESKKIATKLVESKTEKKGPLDQFVSAVSENMPLVYVDTREIPELVEKLRQRGSRVEVKQLDFGDFVVSSDVVIERKTLDDFVKSIYDGRLFSQLVNMNEKYPRPILLIQGDKKHLSGIGETAFYGALASVLADFKVPIFFASNEREVAEIIFHLARREQMEKKRETRIREGRKPVTLAENQRYIVSGIPGVSGVLADRLLSKLETVEKLFSSSELDLLKIDGIGDVMARRIRELASAKYVSATPAEIQKIVDRDSLERYSVTDNRSLLGLETKSEDPAAAFDLPPPSEEE